MDTWSDLRRTRACFEDDAVLALDKPAGISVTGERHDVDLVELGKAAGEWLMPAHRIDKVTSGVVLFAKTAAAHADLARQFNRRSVDKTYLAVTRSTGLPSVGTIELPLSVGRKNRVRVAAPRESIEHDAQTHRWTAPPAEQFATARTYPSLTTFATIWSDDDHSVLAVRPVTGRRHQIRVHLAWIGHPIEGDPLFDKAPAHARTSLHSWKLAVDDEWSRRTDGQAPARLAVRADPDDAFWLPVRDHLPAAPAHLLPGDATTAALDALRERADQERAAFTTAE